MANVNIYFKILITYIHIYRLNYQQIEKFFR